jgi:hypothetical protein
VAHALQELGNPASAWERIPAILWEPPGPASPPAAARLLQRKGPLLCEKTGFGLSTFRTQHATARNLGYVQHSPIVYGKRPRTQRANRSPIVRFVPAGWVCAQDGPTSRSASPGKAFLRAKT